MSPDAAVFLPVGYRCVSCLAAAVLPPRGHRWVPLFSPSSQLFFDFPTSFLAAQFLFLGAEGEVCSSEHSSPFLGFCSATGRLELGSWFAWPSLRHRIARFGAGFRACQQHLRASSVWTSLVIRAIVLVGEKSLLLLQQMFSLRRSRLWHREFSGVCSVVWFLMVQIPNVCPQFSRSVRFLHRSPICFFSRRAWATHVGPRRQASEQARLL